MRPHLAPLAVILAALAVRFAHRSFPIGDDALDFFPLSARLYARLREGSLPLWSPELGLGYPLAGSVEAHLFSPVEWPYLVFLPADAVVVRFVGLFVIAAIAMYVCALVLGSGRAGATVSAIAWVTAGPAIFLLAEPMASATVVWFPLVLACWHRVASGGGWSWSVAAGTLLGIALLGGHAQFVYWFVVFLAGYFAVQFLPAPRRAVLGAIAGGVIMCGVAVAIAAVNVLPTAELVEDSLRADLPVEDRTAGARVFEGGAVHALSQVVFSETGRPLGARSYLREWLVALLAALLALGPGRRFDNRLFVLALGFLVLAFGTSFPPARFLMQSVPFNAFRYPERLGLFFNLAVAILAGRALDRLRTGDGRAWPGTVLALLLSLACVGEATRRVAAPDWPAHAEGLATVVAILCLPLAGALAAMGRARTLRCALAAGAVAALVLHARTATAGFWAGIQPVSTSPGPSPLVSVLPKRDDAGPTRVLDTANPVENAAALTGHQTPLLYGALRPVRLDRLVYGRREVRERGSAPAALLPRQTVLDLLNVRHVVVDAAQYRMIGPERPLTVVARAPDRLVLESRTYLPRAFVVTRAARAVDGEDALARITAPAFDPRREVVIESEAPLPAGPDDTRFSPATVIRHEDEWVEVAVDAPQPGWLVLLDRAAEGWSCEVDGRPADILRANYLFRAVRVPGGRSAASFRYEDPRFRLGAATSLAAGAAAFGWLLWRGLRGRARAEG